MKRSPIRRKARKKVWRRKPSEFARIYGSKTRVAFVKSLGCVVCTAISPFIGIATAGTTHNAHTENGGRGRKADYRTIVPLCGSHHRCYDEHQYPCDGPEFRQALKDAAVKVEQAWQDHITQLGE